MTSILKVAVLVASRGRSLELAQLITALEAQTVAPDQIVLSVTTDTDLPGMLPRNITTVFGNPGSCCQRNAALSALRPDIEVVAFFDDDYLPSRTAVADISSLFAGHPSIVAANGLLLADGIHGPGISYDDAQALIDRFDLAAKPELRVDVGRATYGCNMVFRATAIQTSRFDERLPLYGWQEDIDFSYPLNRLGHIVNTNAFAGVHRGVKGARVSGRKLGYSQIVNPIYLARKGTMPLPFALRLASSNLLANLSKCVRPEPWVDRKGRLEGNLAGLKDLARGRLDPERVYLL